jgi:hypothetical protein
MLSSRMNYEALFRILMIAVTNLADKVYGFKSMDPIGS